MNTIVEEIIKFVVLGALAFIWRELRKFYADVEQNKADVNRLQRAFLVLANRDRKSFDYLRRVLYETTNGRNELQLRKLKQQIDILRENAYRSDEYRKRREAGDPCDEDDGDWNLSLEPGFGERSIKE